MDQRAIEQYLTRIREVKDAQMKPCALVTDEFISSPAHRVGIAHLFLRPRFLLADPVGTGKTPMALVAYGYLKEKDPDIKLVVVCGQAAQFQWMDSVHRFLRNVSAQVLGYHGRTKLTPAQRAKDYAQLVQRDVWITTYAMLTKEEPRLLPALSRFVLVLDEAHGVKNWKGEVVYPAAARLSQKARCVWGLTATPLKNGRESELYSVFNLLRPGTFPSWSEFRRTYFILQLYRPFWKEKTGPRKGERARPFYKELGPQNRDHLQAIIRPFYLKRPASELCAHLPPLTTVVSTVTLDKKQRDLYEHWLAYGKQHPESQLACLTRMQQATSCPELIGDPGIPSAKWEELKRQLQTELSDEKVIIYTKFSETVSWLSAQLTRLGIAHGRITGKDPAKSKDAARLRFQSDPAYNVMLITDAGGESLDLQAARVVVFYDLPWSWGTLTQVVGRIRRIGTAHTQLLAFLLVANSTIDETVLSQLQAKEAATKSTITETESTLTTTETDTETATETAIPTALLNTFRRDSLVSPEIS